MVIKFLVHSERNLCSRVRV